MVSDPAQQGVCLITGGSSGVGRATANQFVENGYLIASCGRDPDRLEQLRAELSRHSKGHLVLPVDLSDVNQTRQFGESVLAQFGRVDVLVNNAAVAPLAPFGDLDEATFEAAININIRSVFYLTQQIWRQMTRQGRGVVVNISSLAAIDPFPGFSVYGSSKAWLDLLSQALAAEGESSSIRTYSIRAGAVETPLLRGLFPDFPADQCVSPQTVAQKVMDCVNRPQQYESGKAYVVTNQV